ncbi:VC0807 family protein [Pseudonocardia nigra]|uniref:VC0807 family protein n=1 Tax=Pseudonocardia nigra TaxID=1921578 RepID=UPI001C5FCE25|nr:VC0807 family protein [Pseudonocardia nigra]
MTAPQTPRPARAAVRTLLLDLAAPLVVFYALRAAGMSDVVALAASALPPTVNAVATAIRTRRMDPVAAAVLLATAIGLVASLITGSPRELLVRGAWLSAPFGLWTLASLLRGRPLTYRVTRTLLPHRAAVMDEKWESDAAFRRTWRMITCVWGGATVVDTVLRVLMAYTLPVPVVPALDAALTLVTLVALQVPTHVLLRRSGFWDLLFRPRLAADR